MRAQPRGKNKPVGGNWPSWADRRVALPGRDPHARTGQARREVGQEGRWLGSVHLAPPQAAAHSRLRACRPQGPGRGMGVSVGPRNVQCVPQFCSRRKREHWTSQPPPSVDPGLWAEDAGRRARPGCGARLPDRLCPVPVVLLSLLVAASAQRAPVWLLEASPAPTWVWRSQPATGTPALEAAPLGRGLPSGPADQACADGRGRL